MHDPTPLDRLRALAFAVIIGELAGCGAAEVPTPDFTSHDSAGIAISDNRELRTGSGLEWRLSAQPLLTIGVVHGEDAYQLWDVRAALRLSNGQIVLANSGTRQLRYFDAEGRLVASAGREGKGPGEFRALSSVFRYRGDSVAAFDLGNRRLTVVGPDGGFGRTLTLWPPPSENAAVLPCGAASDGSLFGVTADPIVPSDPPRVSRPLQRVYRFDSLGRYPVLVGRFPGALRYQGSGTVLGVVSFTGRSLYEVRDERLFVVMTDTFALQERALDGRLLRIIRLAWEPTPVTPAHIELERKQQLEAWGERYARLPPQMMQGKRTLMEVMPFPSTFPAVDTIAVAQGGSLWVRPYVPIGSPQVPRRWLVFDKAGRYAGGGSFPEGFTVLDIGRDYALGVTRDELGVESVRLHAIEWR